MVRLLFLLTSLLLLGSCDCYRIVQGVVVDSLNNRPLKDAIVINTDRHWVSLETDSSGKFELKDITGAKCPPMKVRVTKVGYKQQDIFIRSGKTAVVLMQPE